MRTAAVCVVAFWGMLAGGTAVAQTAATQLPGVNGPAAEVTLSNSAFDISYLTNAGGFNLTNSQLAGGFFLSEDRDVVGTVGVMVPTDLRLGKNISLDLGPRAYLGFLRDENEDVMAIAVGVQARMDLLRSRELAIVGSAFYAPDILTFGAGDNIVDLAARAEMRVTQRVVGYAGWRWFEVHQPGPDDRTLQDALVVGFRWRFE